jgi:hypothetical protein
MPPSGPALQTAVEAKMAAREKALATVLRILIAVFIGAVP